MVSVQYSVFSPEYFPIPSTREGQAGMDTFFNSTPEIIESLLISAIRIYPEGNGYAAIILAVAHKRSSWLLIYRNIKTQGVLFMT